MKRKIKVFYSIVILFMIMTLLGFSYSYYEARNINVVQHTFVHKDIPASFDGKKIIFISDIHSNRYFDSLDVANLVIQINELNPDIIILGGDNTDKDSTYSTPFFNEVKKLRAHLGIFSVLGNHDHWEGASFIQDGLVEAGVSICDNQSYWIHLGSDSIKLGGVGDLWEDEQNINETIHDVDSDNFCILLSHNPDYIEQLESNLIDLILSGHTHGGQVTIFGLYAPVMPALWRPHLPDTGQKYRYGWKEYNNIPIYITSGIGLGEFPFRFFSPPEIVEITLKKE